MCNSNNLNCFCCHTAHSTVVCNNFCRMFHWNLITVWSNFSCHTCKTMATHTSFFFFKKSGTFLCTVITTFHSCAALGICEWLIWFDICYHLNMLNLLLRILRGVMKLVNSLQPCSCMLTPTLAPCTGLIDAVAGESWGNLTCQEKSGFCSVACLWNLRCSIGIICVQK